MLDHLCSYGALSCPWCRGYTLQAFDQVWSCALERFIRFTGRVQRVNRLSCWPSVISGETRFGVPCGNDIGERSSLARQFPLEHLGAVGAFGCRISSLELLGFGDSEKLDSFDLYMRVLWLPG